MGVQSQEWNNTSVDLLPRATHSCMVLTMMKHFHQWYDSAVFVHYCPLLFKIIYMSTRWML